VEERICLLDGCVLPWPAVAPTRQKPSVGKAWVRRSLGIEQASSITALGPLPCPTMNSPSLSAAGLCRWIEKRRTCPNSALPLPGRRKPPRPRLSKALAQDAPSALGRTQRND